MAEHDENEPRAERAAEPAPHDAGGGVPGHEASTPQGAPAGEPRPAAEHAAAGTVPPPQGAAPPSRFRRWSGSRPVQLVAVGLLTGVVGGLVGGGIVAAFDDDGGSARHVRVERGGPMDGPRFRGPYRMPFRGPYAGPPNGRRAPNIRPGNPGGPGMTTPPAPSPSPKATG